MSAGERGADYVMFGEVAAEQTPAIARGDRRAHRNGGRSCSRFPASDSPPTRRKSAARRPRAPISSRSAISSGTTRAARPQRSPRFLAVPETELPGTPSCSRACLFIIIRQLQSNAAPFRLPVPPAAQPSETRSGLRAFQRGQYVTAFREATRRVEEKSDPKAMTLLGELYADGLGVANDDRKAVDWYKLASARGDREAMFALAIFKMTGPRRPARSRRGGTPAGRSGQARPRRRGL